MRGLSASQGRFGPVLGSNRNDGRLVARPSDGNKRNVTAVYKVEKTGKLTYREGILLRTAMAIGSLLASFVTAVPGLTAGTAGGPSGGQTPVDPIWREVVIQGQVTEVSPGWAVVRTADWRPTCPPGKMCAQYIIPGTTYRVDTSAAEFQTSSGQPLGAGELFVGEHVAVFGTVPEVPGRLGAAPAYGGQPPSDSASPPFLAPAAPPLPDPSAPPSPSAEPSASARVDRSQSPTAKDAAKDRLLRARIIEEIQGLPRTAP